MDLQRRLEWVQGALLWGCGFLWIITLTLPTTTEGCILLLNGWEPLGVAERAPLADIVLTGFIRRAHKENRTSANTYSVQFQIFSYCQ